MEKTLTNDEQYKAAVAQLKTLSTSQIKELINEIKANIDEYRRLEEPFISMPTEWALAAVIIGLIIPIIGIIIALWR